MNDSSLAIPSVSENALPLSAPNPMMWNQPPGTRSESVPITGIDDGSASSVSTNLCKIPEKVQSLERAMRHLTTHERKAFQDALQSAPPQIWENECNPELFLRVEKCDIQKAGERMAQYWQLRSQTFGQKQYDLLTQTGENALGRKELQALTTGFLTLLPTDANGQSILFVDLSRLSDNLVNLSLDTLRDCVPQPLESSCLFPLRVSLELVPVLVATHIVFP